MPTEQQLDLRLRQPRPKPVELHFEPGHYFVSGGGGWFVIRCSTMRVARRWGVREFGRGSTRQVRHATNADLAAYKAQRGMPQADQLPLEDDPS